MMILLAVLVPRESPVRITWFVPQVPFQTDEYIMKVEWVRNGLCAAYLPQSCVKVAQAIAGDLYVISEKDNPEWFRMVAIMHKKKTQMTEVALDFLDFMLDFFHEPGSQPSGENY